VRRTLVLVAAAVVVGVPAAGAASIDGTARADRLVGTERADRIDGRAGADRLFGRGGDDALVGGTGPDRVEGGAGADRLALEQDGSRDRGSCGPGRDLVAADRTDAVAADCEVVTVPISSDPYRTQTGQHRTQVEPDSFAHGSTVVAAFQSGRNFDGGAANIGVSTSTDAGRTWRPSFLPGLTVYSTPAGVHPAVSDPVVAYDDASGRWLVGSLGVSPGLTELLISHSRDGVSWEAPVAAARTVSGSLAYDKEWLVCDSWPASRFRGRCYLGYTDVRRDVLAVQTSPDGGDTWLPAVTAGEGVFAMPAVQPDGTLVVVFLGGGETGALVAAVSRDGGVSFGPAARIAELHDADVGRLRAPPVPSAEVAADGRVVVVWHDAAFRAGTDVVLSSSLDGVAWTAPSRVPAVPTAGGAEAFVPGVGVDPASAGASTRIAVVTYGNVEGVGVDAWLVRSADAGARWSVPQRLTPRPMPLAWIARTRSGVMLADYLSVSWAGGRPVPVISLASPTVGTGERRFRQAIATTIRGT
jgi:hypothetical protein